MVCADDTVIGAIPSPCYGELALGENKKASAAPVEIKTLDKVYCLDVGMGVSHSIFVARNETEADKKAIESYDVLDQATLTNNFNRLKHFIPFESRMKSLI